MPFRIVKNLRSTDKGPWTSQLAACKRQDHVLPAPLSCPETRLTQSLVSVLEEGSRERDHGKCWGEWLRFLPPLVGRNPALDHAAALFVTGRATLRSQDTELLRQARITYSLALRSLQEQILLETCGPSIESVAAVRLLCMFEVMTILEMIGQRIVSTLTDLHRCSWALVPELA